MATSGVPDYYAVLGIDAHASAKEIKQAYQRESLRTHPDRFPNASADEKRAYTQKFQTIADACTFDRLTQTIYYLTRSAAPSTMQCVHNRNIRRFHRTRVRDSFIRRDRASRKHRVNLRMCGPIFCALRWSAKVCLVMLYSRSSDLAHVWHSVRCRARIHCRKYTRPDWRRHSGAWIRRRARCQGQVGERGIPSAATRGAREYPAHARVESARVYVVIHIYWHLEKRKARRRHSCRGQAAEHAMH